MEAALVGFEVETDFGVFGQADVAVDVDANVVTDEAIFDAASGEDGAAGDDGIESDAHAVGISEDEFGGRILRLVGTQRPLFVVKIEDRRDTDEIHVGFVIGVEGADIAPVKGFLAVFVDEVVGEDAVLGDDAGKNVFAEVVCGFGFLGIGEKGGDEELGIENVDAHGGVAVGGLVRGGFGFGGFFLEAHDAPVPVRFNDAELADGFGSGNFDGGDGAVGGGIDMLLKHFCVIHFVDVIAGEDENVFRALAADGINVLINGVGSALIPLLGDAHLRRENFDIFAEAHEGRPSGAEVADKAEGFVLSEYKYAMKIGINAIGESDVNNAVESAKGHGGLSAVAGEGPA